MSVRAPGGISSSFITGALLTRGRAALLTFLLRLLHARMEEVGEEVGEDEVELVAADEEEVVEDEEIVDIEEEVDAAEDEAEVDEEEVDEDKVEEEVELGANEVVLLELLLDTADDEDDLRLDVEEVVGLTRVELVVGLIEIELVVGLIEVELGVVLMEEEVEVEEDNFTDEVVEDGLTDVDVAFDEELLVNFTEEDDVEEGFLELELEEIAFALLLETTLLVDDETLELLVVVALLLTTELAGVDTGLAAVLALSADEDEVFFELEEASLLELFEEVDEAFLDEDEEVVVDALVVTTRNWVFKVDFAVEDDFFLVEDDFFVEDDFLVELDLCVELEDFVIVLVTALSTSSTLQDPDSGLHSISVVTAGDTLPATAETSSRAKAEMVEMLRIFNQRITNVERN